MVYNLYIIHRTSLQHILYGSTDLTPFWTDLKPDLKPDLKSKVEERELNW